MQGNDINNLYPKSAAKSVTERAQRSANRGDSRRSQWAFPRRVLWLTVLLILIVSKAHAQNYTYAYDELGRLVAVVDPSGNAGVYSYDKVGNLLTITNTTASTVSIFTFTPNNGPAGSTTVTIYGDGFSTTPSSNTVTFNGTAATVSSSTVATIVVAVPAGATTGTALAVDGGMSGLRTRPRST